MNRSFKLLIVPLIALVLLSCSKDLFISDSYQVSFKAIKDAFADKEQFLTKDIIDSIPYASALISFGGGQSLIILESKTNKKLSWVSADKKVFFTKNGRVISTIGLKNNLYSIQAPFLSFKDVLKKKTIDYKAYYSFRDTELNNVEVRVKVNVIGREKVDMLGYQKELILIEEDLFSEKINWNSKNKFWIDPVNKFVWKSEQSLSPRLPILKITVTRAPL